MTRASAAGEVRPTTRVGSAASSSVPARVRRRKRRSIAPYLLVAPYVVFLAGFGIAPTVNAVYTSFFSPNALGGTTFAPGKTWTGMFTDYRLLTSVRNVATYLAMWLPATLVVIFALALVLHARPGRFAGSMRFVYYLPGAITGSAAALLWLFMWSPDVSPFGPILKLLGVQSATSVISGHTSIVLAVMGVAIHAGGWIVIVYAALAGLPKDVMEAAMLDGASAWQVAIHVKLPMVKRYIALILIATFAAGTQVFVEPEVLGIGVPGQISHTWSINQLAYYFATQRNDFGKAAALSLVLLAVGLALALFVIFRTKFYRVGGDSR